MMKNFVKEVKVYSVIFLLKCHLVLLHFFKVFLLKLKKGYLSLEILNSINNLSLNYLKRVVVYAYMSPLK